MECKHCNKTTNKILEVRLSSTRTPLIERKRDNCCYIELGAICSPCLTTMQAAIAKGICPITEQDIGRIATELESDGYAPVDYASVKFVVREYDNAGPNKPSN